ncbi:T9SS type A sorting domain-containing protein [Hymenobacter metallicola]|uniref:T9SS type A sorting domain-containing protein n=1 Tax=Hymenobacter metallicola TaxID=2563114 RepID=A0A4Z0PT81_9BACT|nr:T9SS type A sorting domain-containing protein [Hymenobacter metallicola]TGE20898.1 T9SS type A sorting domain-containing protein [Hymenobacter metallicola]
MVYPVGDNPQGVALADVNGDTRPDLVVTCSYASSVNVLLSQLDGTFAPALSYAIGSFPIRVTLADVNEDGLPDILAALQWNGGIAVMLNSSTAPGAFLPPTILFTQGNPRSLAVGDIDRDGHLDIVGLNLNGGTVGVLLNSAAAPGMFPATATTYATGGNNAVGVALGDVNGDGWLDLVVCGGSTGKIGVLLNQAAPAGTFAPVVSYGSGASYPQDLAVGDVNADGRADIVVAGGNDARVGVLLNSTTTPGVFPAMATTYATGAQAAYSVELGDMNGDRQVDIVTGSYVINSISSTVGVLVNSAAAPGIFPAGFRHFASGGLSAHDVALNDADGDGRLDIATVNYSSSTVAVLRNTGTFLPATPSRRPVEVSLFPNPARTTVTVRLDETAPRQGLQLVLVDATGRTTNHKPVSGTNGELVVELKQQPAGLYLVRVEGPKGYVATQRLVIE